jgi:hypothetical protein
LRGVHLNSLFFEPKVSLMEGEVRRWVFCSVLF